MVLSCQNDPFFSIIVPVYNRAHLIEKTLRSLQQQDYDQYEIIIVDDGSTDDLREVVGKMADQRTQYVYKENGERAAARNHGARLAKGTYLNFFDSDDIALPNHLRVAAELVTEKKHPEWFHLGFAYAYPNGEIFRTINNYKGATTNKQIVGNPLGCNSVFVKREIALQYPFNEDRDLSITEDYELWCRLAARFPLYYNNTITSLLIEHDARSMNSTDGRKLIRRMELFITYLEKDTQVVKYFGKYLNRIKMDAWFYCAINLAKQPEFKKDAIRFLIKALQNSYRILFRRRFYFTIKKVLFA